MAGFPVVIDNSLPNLAASTTGGPIFRNLSHAMVRRTVRNGVTVMRLDQRFADYLAIGYIGYMRTDTRSNDMRAAVTVKPAAT
jgi:HK97 family phage major capsid protein